jgi:Mrp family chromosome partitioning ATPase
MNSSLTNQVQMLLSELGWKSRQLGTIGITSSHSREGVSTIAAALARAAAPMGEDVLLAELLEPEGLPAAARPRVARTESDAAGPVEFGAPTKVENLYTLNAGSVSPDDAADMEEFIARLRTRYALCIFDLPPVLEDGRSAALAAKLDTTVIVIRSGSTSVEDVRRTERVLARNGVNVSGAVLNRCRD